MQYESMRLRACLLPRLVRVDSRTLLGLFELYMLCYSLKTLYETMQPRAIIL